MKQLLFLLLLIISFTTYAQTGGSVMITGRNFTNDGKGNLGLELKFTNESNKTIRNMVVSVWPIDIRGNNLCDDNGFYSYDIKFNDAIASGKCASISEKFLFRNCSDQISCLKVMSIKVKYDDNSSQEIFGKELNNHYRPTINPNCQDSAASL